MIFVFSNFGEAALEERLGSADTSLRIAPSDSERFPQPGDGERFAAILYDGVQSPEVVWGVSNPRTGVIVIERGKENSAAKAWLPGTAFIHTLTTASIEYFVTSGQQDWIDQLVAEDAAIRAELAEEAAAREALAETVGSNFGTLTQRADDNAAAVQLVAVAVADQQEANAAYQLTLSARMDDAEGLIEENYLAFTTFEQSQLTYNQSMLARVDDVEAELVTQATTFADYETATATTLNQLRADLDDASAALTAESTARATQYDALAEANTTLTASLGDTNASLTTTQLAFADLEGNVSARYGVQLNADGTVAGFSIMAGVGPAGAAVSEVKFNVSNFILSTPDGEFSPFVFDTDTGVAYLQNIVVDGALIENLVVHWADIEDVSIDGALIQDATISGAKIGDLEVDTIKIKDAAVTNMLDAFTSSSGLLSTAENDQQGVDFHTTGQRLLIEFSGYLDIWHPAGGGITCTLKLYRIQGATEVVIWSKVLSATGDDFLFGWQSVSVPDEPPEGDYLYQLTAQLSVATATTATFTSRYMSVTEFKR